MQAAASGGEASFGALGRRDALLHGHGGGVAGLHEGARALEGEVRLHPCGLGLYDLALGLDDRGLGLGDDGEVRGFLRLDHLAREPGEDLALLDPGSLLDEELGDAETLDLGRHQDLVAGDQGPGHDGFLDEFAPESGHHGHGGSDGGRIRHDGFLGSGDLRRGKNRHGDGEE